MCIRDRQGSGNGDALLLPTLESGAAFADLGLVAFGQLLDHFVDFGWLVRLSSDDGWAAFIPFQ